MSALLVGCVSCVCVAFKDSSTCIGVYIVDRQLAFKVEVSVRGRPKWRTYVEACLRGSFRRRQVEGLRKSAPPVCSD